MQDTNPRSRYVRWVAARTLGKVGPIESDQVQRVVVAALAQRVSDEDLGIRRAAATALANFGNVAGDARPALAWAVVRGGDTEVRLAAIRAVAAIGEATDPVIDALADSLTASKMDIRKEAARALGAVDTSRARKEQSAAFQKATDALLRVMATDQDSEFRALASTAVLQMRSPARPRKGL
jgi:HEAT repeat protein